MDRSPPMITSRLMRSRTARASMDFMGRSMIRVPLTSTLSATGSRNFPMIETLLSFSGQIAIQPIGERGQDKERTTPKAPVRGFEKDESHKGWHHENSKQGGRHGPGGKLHPNPVWGPKRAGAASFYNESAVHTNFVGRADSPPFSPLQDCPSLFEKRFQKALAFGFKGSFFP